MSINEKWDELLKPHKEGYSKKVKESSPNCPKCINPTKFLYERISYFGIKRTWKKRAIYCSDCDFIKLIDKK
jgi:hypothetical protein